MLARFQELDWSIIMGTRNVKTIGYGIEELLRELIRSSRGLVYKYEQLSSR